MIDISDISTTLSGFAVGSIVGVTGVGGGALMTPLLVLLFGVAPQTAVGTDLIFACITKVFGAFVHGKRGTVDWPIVRRLALGSLPGAMLTLFAMEFAGTNPLKGGIILRALGAVLFLTALGLFMRKRLHRRGQHLRNDVPEDFKRVQPVLTVIVGVVVGVLVTLTSVGAGALGTVALVYLYPYRLTPTKLVGTDIAHAIPLTLVAGLGHLMLGDIHVLLLGKLLLGSIPGILLGSMLSVRIPESVVRNAIAVVLVLVGLRLLW